MPATFDLGNMATHSACKLGISESQSVC